MKKIAIAIAFSLFSLSAYAATVRSSNGATASVAHSAAHSFQCIINKLEHQGYKIHFMGGYRRHGSVRASLHPAGLALDINQYSRNVTRPRMPANEIQIANSCGAISGAQWGWKDSGHFQIANVASRRHHRYARYKRHYDRNNFARNSYKYNVSYWGY
jgi:hypothetical protein